MNIIAEKESLQMLDNVLLSSMCAEHLYNLDKKRVLKIEIRMPISDWIFSWKSM